MAATELPAFICMAAPNKEVIHARGWHAVAASSSCYWRDDHWRATKPPSIICMVFNEPCKRMACFGSILL
eukprot:scaffold6220_cov133-Chaetoceros_neogracile.AAC.1